MIRRTLVRHYAPRMRRDVAFYTPWIGSILSSAGLLPPGGAETQILMLASELADRGEDLALVVFGTPEEVPPSVDGVDLVVRPPYRQRRRFVEKIVETFLLWRSLWHARARTVVVRGAGAVLGLVGIYTWLTGTRLVFSVANVVDFNHDEITQKRRDLLLYALGIRVTQEIVVQTEEQAEMCAAKYHRRATLIKSISPVAERQVAPGEAFLWVGRLVSYKQPLEYLKLARALPEALFWMVGVPLPHHESDRAVAEAVMREAAEIPNLELLDPRPHEEVEQLMARAVASVNTAKYEGMPNVLLEAWSRGVPALVLDHDPGGVITDHGLGAFAAGSHERFVELARELWVSRADRETLAERCQAYITGHHAPDVVAEQWSALLHGRLVRPRPGSTRERVVV